MSITAEVLRALIDGELANVSDARVIAYIRGMLVEPYVVQRSWDYGEPGQQYPCWMVLSDPSSGGEIAYCEHGFGPRCSWGLVSSGRGEGVESMGMDSGWYRTFLDAFFESFASVNLPIWRVFSVEPDGTKIALTNEGPWEATWEQVYELRSREPTKRIDCGHNIAYGEK
jgi:hypothetical protein